jgi:HEAT repeat protein
VLEKPGGAARVRACELLAKLDVPRTTKVLQQLVDDADPLVAVQASAVLYGRGHLQLRSRLSELVAHRLPEVSQVACRALRRSSFLWYLSEFDSMTPEVRQSEGRVVWRVDGAARELLALELRGATVKRRVRAIEMVDAMGLVAEFIDMLVDLATDSDAEVRCAAVQRLAKSPRMSAVEALANAKRDKNGAVRRAAIEAEQQAAAASGHRDSPPQGDVP